MSQTFNASSIDTAVTTPAGLGGITKDALLALQSNFSGASLPATNLVGGQIALDTTNNVYWRRDPANTKWMLHASAADALVAAKSGAYTAVLGDFEKTINCTGTWALSLAAAATLTDGWSARVINSGSGTITIDPNASETINGAATLALYPSEDGFIVCDGSGFRISRLASILSNEDATAVVGSTTLDTYTDTANSLTLSPGKWLIRWGGGITVTSSGGTGLCIPELTLTKSDNTVIKRAVGHALAAATAQYF